MQRVFVYDMCCSVPGCVEVCLDVLQCAWMCCSVPGCVAVCLDVLQCAWNYVRHRSLQLSDAASVSMCRVTVSLATHCSSFSTLQHTQSISVAAHSHLSHTATHCKTLQHTATHCNTLQHTAQHQTASVAAHSI